MRICALGLVALAALVIRADAAPILHIHDAQGNLAGIDVATGVITPIGNMGVVLTDIAINPVTGDLFGISFTHLFSINPVTALATQVGTGLGVAPPSSNALTFSDDGTKLYGANNFILFEIDTTTGLGSNGRSSGYSAGDLAFHGGALYLTSFSNQLVRIADPNMGTGTAVGPIGFSSIFGLASANGVLYGATGHNLIAIDTATGAGTLVHNFAGQAFGNGSFGSSFGLTYLAPDAPPATMPEPSTLMLSSLTLLFVCGKAYQKGRQA